MRQKSHNKTGVSSFLEWRHLLFLVLWIGLVVVLMAQIVNASTYISQSYLTSTDLPTGSIVSLKKDTTDQVVAADNKNVNNLLGVVVNASNSIMSLTSNKNGRTEVATSGTLQVLASDINGPIFEGDQITASPISGIGMKATSNVRTIGITQGDLTKQNSSEQSYTDKDGNKKQILIGQIPVQVSVSYFFKEPEKTIIPTALQNIANALAGKQVSTLPILVSIAIFIITIVVVVSIIFSMIRSSIISVGRNPMSQSAIYRDLVQLSALVLVILSVGMISIYLVLTRM